MLLENLREAITSILSNKMRSVLTMLGIIIGISSVITITTIGSSLQSTINASMNSVGGAAVYVYLDANYDWNSGESYPQLTDDDYIPVKSVERLLKKYPDEILGIVEEIYLGNGRLFRDDEHRNNVIVYGESAGAIEKSKLKILAGRNLTDEDSEKKKNVCLITDHAAKYYFGENVNPIGEIIDVSMMDGSSMRFAVVGVFKFESFMYASQEDPRDTTTQIFVPVGTAKKIANVDNTGYESLQFMINPSADSSVVAEHIREYFDELYADNPTWYVEVYDVMADMKIINVVINVITIAISIIAAISLVVGGVGVMNIMLVSITERTKEIGVRMAMGATRKVIRVQFVIEAIVLCVIGGILGIIFGITAGATIGALAKIIVTTFYPDYANYIVISISPSVPAILISLLFSGLTGVFFGFYPANKAAKMEVIDALRYE